MYRKSLLVLIVVLSGVGAVAQTPAPSQTVDQTQLDSLRSAGYEALYNLDYETARRHFRQMVDLAPDHPAGAQCYAASLWVQQLNESWELKATLYSADSYANSKARANQKQTTEFRDWTRRAKRLSEARLRTNRRDVEALYFLGATEGLESAFAAAVERKFMAALRNGSDAVDHHREVLKLAPGFHDAELTIGIYNYVIGALPLPLKMLARTTGVSGSKKRGLETLERVSREGQWARDLARVLLVDLYKREKRFADAVAIARQLSEKYPRNYLFKLQTADALTLQMTSLRKANKVDEVKALEPDLTSIFESLLREPLEPATLDLVHFRYGEAIFSMGRPEEASKEFSKVLNRNGAEPGLKTMCRLRVAQTLDLAGKRTQALNEYRAVLGGIDVHQAHDEARRGLRQPFKTNDFKQ